MFGSTICWIYLSLFSPPQMFLWARRQAHSPMVQLHDLTGAESLFSSNSLSFAFQTLLIIVRVLFYPQRSTELVSEMHQACLAALLLNVLERFSSDDSSIKAIFVQLSRMFVSDPPDLILTSTASVNCSFLIASWAEEMGKPSYNLLLLWGHQSFSLAADCWDKIRLGIMKFLN